MSIRLVLNIGALFFVVLVVTIVLLAIHFNQASSRHLTMVNRVHIPTMDHLVQVRYLLKSFNHDFILYQKQDNTIPKEIDGTIAEMVRLAEKIEERVPESLLLPFVSEIGGTLNELMLLNTADDAYPSRAQWLGHSLEGLRKELAKAVAKEPGISPQSKQTAYLSDKLEALHRRHAESFQITSAILTAYLDQAEVHLMRLQRLLGKDMEKHYSHDPHFENLLAVLEQLLDLTQRITPSLSRYKAATDSEEKAGAIAASHGERSEGW